MGWKKYGIEADGFSVEWGGWEFPKEMVSPVLGAIGEIIEKGVEIDNPNCVSLIDWLSQQEWGEEGASKVDALVKESWYQIGETERDAKKNNQRFSSSKFREAVAMDSLEGLVSDSKKIELFWSEIKSQHREILGDDDWRLMEQLDRAEEISSREISIKEVNRFMERITDALGTREGFEKGWVNRAAIWMEGIFAKSDSNGENRKNKYTMRLMMNCVDGMGSNLKEKIESSTRNWQQVVEEYLGVVAAARNYAERFDNTNTRTRLIKEIERIIKTKALEVGSIRGGIPAAMILVGGWEGRLRRGLDEVRESLEPRVVANWMVSSDQIAEKGNSRYLFVLPDLLHREYFDKVGKHILEMKNGGELVEVWPREEKMPLWLAERVAEVFVQAGLVGRTKNNRLRPKTRRGIYPASLGWDSVREVKLAMEALTDEIFPEKRSITTLEEAGHEHERYQEKIAVPELRFELEKEESNHTLLLTDLRFGHKDTDYSELMSLLDWIVQLSPSERPTTVVLGDLIEGGYEMRETEKRAALDGAMESVSNQFAVAKDLVTRLQAMDIRVVHVIGDQTEKMVHDWAIKMIQFLREKAAFPLREGANSDFIAYYQENQLARDKSTQQHKRFEREVVMPYCFRLGRRLRSAIEMGEFSDGEIEMEEYLILLQVWKKLANGQQADPDLLKWVDLSQLPLPGRDFGDYQIVDDAKLILEEEGGRTFTQRFFARTGFSPTVRYGDPLVNLEKFTGQVLSAGSEIPDMTVDLGAGYGVGREMAEAENQWVVAAPSGQRVNPNQRGSTFRTTGDTSLRQFATRRVRGTPMYLSYARNKWGSLDFCFWNDKLRQKAEAMKGDPRVVVVWQDWQIGSPTARPDLQAKLVDYTVREVGKDAKVHLVVNGDILAALNYPGAALDNTRYLLTRIDDAEEFTRRLVRLGLAGFRPEELERIGEVDVTVGNHEWNSGNKYYGQTHTQWMVQTLKEILPNGREKVRFCDTLATQSGDFMVNAWTSNRAVGEYGLWAQHLILDKMAKGSGSLPIYQAIPALSGLGNLLENTDIGVFGHWHNGMWIEAIDKLFLIGPSVASQSTYEWLRGYRPKMGALVIYLGDNLPVRARFVSLKELYDYQIGDGPLSQQALHDTGFEDDAGFDPRRHGFATRTANPQSALQKKLWHEIDQMMYQAASVV